MGVNRPGIGGGIRARRAADGRLVDANHLVDQLDAFDGLVRARFLVRAVDLPRQRAVENLVDQGGFAAAGNARHHGEQAERDVHVDVLEVVLGGAANRQLLVAGLRAARPAPRLRALRER